MTPLYATPQWIVVLLVPQADGKIDKLPVDHRTGLVTVKGSDGAHDPAIWMPHDQAAAYAAAMGPSYTVGFVITAADPFFCLDIDGAAQPDGTWSLLSQHLVASLPGCSVEVSLSGKGLHIWGRGRVPPHSKKNIPLHIELYSERRFIAIGRNAVGEMAPECPTIAAVAAQYFPPKETAGAVPDEGPRADWRGPADDEELLRRAMMSKSAASVFGGGKASFADLWHADAAVLARVYPADSNSNEAFDRSSADMALAQHLAFWTGCDVARIERLMQRSALKRGKWEREDYLVERTIMGACAQQRDVLQDKPMELPAEVEAAPEGAPGMSPVSGSTFLNVEQQMQLFAGCIYVLDHHKALVPGGHLVNPDRFKAKFGGYTFAMDTRNERTSRNAWEAFTESQALRAPRVDGVCFRPDLPYGAIVVDAGRTRANMWWPVEVPRKKGDPTRFLSHVAKLFPNQADAKLVLYYMAACVQHQGYKFQWAPLLIGVEGNGKTLLSRCVAEAVGRRYVHWPKASKIAKQFNAWMLYRTFYPVEDIHTAEGSDVIEELKPMITGGDGLEIEAKGVDQVSTEICGNFMFNSNHKNAIKKTRNDRRFAIFYCAQQTAEDLQRDGITPDYMVSIYDWLRKEGGYEIVAELLWTLPIPDEFNPAKGLQRAPRTSSTDEAIAASLGRVEQEILEAIDQGLPGFAGGWISSLAVDRLMEKLGRAGAVAPNKRRDMLRELGYDWHPALVGGRVNNTVSPDGGKPRLFVKAGHAALALKTPSEVAQAYSAAQSVFK